MSIPRDGSQGTASLTRAAWQTRTLSFQYPRGGQRTARPTTLIAKHGRWSVVRAINPNPIFDAFAQFFANGIHQDVAGLFIQLVLIAQAMVEEVPLPFDSMFDRHKLLPVCNRGFYSRLAREGNDGVQMVGHQQAQAAMPDQFVVIVFHCGKNGIAGVGAAELVLTRRHAFDGDEKPTAFSHPLRDGVRQLFADRQIHA